MAKLKCAGLTITAAMEEYYHCGVGCPSGNHCKYSVRGPGPCSATCEGRLAAGHRQLPKEQRLITRIASTAEMQHGMKALTIAEHSATGAPPAPESEVKVHDPQTEYTRLQEEATKLCKQKQDAWSAANNNRRLNRSLAETRDIMRDIANTPADVTTITALGILSNTVKLLENAGFVVQNDGDYFDISWG